MNIEYFKIGNWNFAVKPLSFPVPPKRKFLAWTAQYDELGKSPLSIPLEIDVYFEFGSTAEEALTKLQAEVDLLKI